MAGEVAEMRASARARLAVLRVRAAERRATHTGPWADTDRDRALSAEMEPFRLMQFDTDAWRA